jgi:hypothetical protein
MANENSCGDGYCVLLIGRRAGQHTNGGCHCLREIPLDLRRRILRKLRADQDQLAVWSRWADEVASCWDASWLSRDDYRYASFFDRVADCLDNRPDKEE